MYSFQPTAMGSLPLRNHIVMAPMCMNSADSSGHVQTFHKVHYANAALGGVGLILVEATAVVPEGRILGKDLGLWSDDQVPGHRALTESCHEFGACIGIQLAHAGRKCAIACSEIYAPSAEKFDDSYALPLALDEAGILRVRQGFAQAARRSVDAGYDLIEVHAAHGYLLHQFLSPLTNHRTDGYGGSREGRVRLLQEVLKDIRAVIPPDMPLLLRVSATDYKEGGLDLEETIQLLSLVQDEVDVVHVSSGALVADASMKVYPGYQVPLAQAVKKALSLPVIAVGLITKLEQAEEILGNGRADFVALGRLLLRDPFVLLRWGQGEVPVPQAIERGFPFLWNWPR
ncbi:hypothetical protein ABB02_00820 [Clostridiaceae bacterium JG1575]|nr:hypothetical protein ABB02_00820 [Clostridiaceae bacterium JG1575]